MQYFISIQPDSQLVNFLKTVDRWLFTKVNHDWTTPFLDNVFPVWREAITWVPLYIFLLLVMFINFGNKIWPWIVGMAVTIALSDQISSHLLKPLVQRPRPCHDPMLADHIRLLLKYCSNSFSFTSSHATNHFAIAFFIYLTMKEYFGKWAYLFLLWAATISYGQVYIGVHYPLDVVSGAILGTGIGSFTAYVFNKRFGLPPLQQKNNSLQSV